MPALPLRGNQSRESKHYNPTLERLTAGKELRESGSVVNDILFTMERMIGFGSVRERP
jgi:hypothetical protein